MSGFPGPNQVIVYEGNGRGGPSRVLEFGNYPTPSTFGLANDSISSIDVGSNARAVLYEHTQFGGRQTHFEGGFYWDPIGRTNNRASSIEVFPMDGGPAATSYLGNYPRNRENFWSQDAQGLANDGINWYAVKSPAPPMPRPPTVPEGTSTAEIFQIPLTVALGAGSADGLRRDGLPRDLRTLGYDHLGDPDQRLGFLFVPIEDNHRYDVPRAGPQDARIGVWRAEDLSFQSSFELADNKAPWLAIRPGQDTLWMSRFDDVDRVQVFDIVWERLTGTHPAQLVLDNPRSVVLRDRDGATLTLDAVQGGVFNSSGRLLYISNGDHDTPGYVHVFSIDDETNTATLQARSEDGYGPFNFENRTRILGDEAEGLDWLDVRGLNVPGIVEGQLHLVMVDNDLLVDDLYVKHYSGRTDLDVV